MNYTEKYHLPQWEETDRIMRTDFNRMCADMEEGLTQAQGTANTALEKAGNAYSDEQKPYVVGRYYGASAAKSFNLGFRPSFLIVSGMEKCYSVRLDEQIAYILITAGEAQAKAVTFTDTGFTLNKMESTEYPKLLEQRNYNYIAFR